MFNSDQIIYLQISNKEKFALSVIVGSVFILLSALSIYYVFAKPPESEGFRLAAIALLPTATFILLGWIFILKLRGTLDEKDLMRQTARILGSEIPQAITRRIYGFHRESDGHFTTLSGKENKELKGIKNLYTDESIDEISKLIKVSSNILVGVPSCIYRFNGVAIPEYTFASTLQMCIQLNVKRVEVIYRLQVPEDSIEECVLHFDGTQRGAEKAGYDVIIVRGEGECGPYCEMQARLAVSNEMLVNSRERLFIINDIAVMTAYLLIEMARKKYTATEKFGRAV